MDSISQMALGAAIGVATMGRRTAVWKSALCGAIAGTLPDLDVFVDHGDPILNMVLHRAESHSLFWLTLFSIPLAGLFTLLSGKTAMWRRWWLLAWLALVTHPLLDTLTVYGTQLLLPFTPHPFGVGSVFIIDPLYTLPLLLGAGWALASRGNGLGLKANAWGLVLSTAYLAWGIAAQQHVTGIATTSLQQKGITHDRLLVTPAPFNSVLWRVVAMDATHYHEGFYSLLDTTTSIQFDRFDRGSSLTPAVQGIDGVQRVQAFSKGFYKLQRQGDRLLVTDLRMGQEPDYVFSFAIAQQHSPLRPLVPAEKMPVQRKVDLLLPWLWKRMGGQMVPPPRTEPDLPG